jgi:Ala-tRNA(Pro) deacylase
MAIADTVKNYLAQKSVDYDMVSHPHTGSSHESAAASHVRDDHVAKAVIVKDAAGYAMVVIPASHWVETKHLHRELDRDFELVQEDELAPLFPDCESGAVPPLGPAYEIETFMDEALAALANVYFEAGDHEHLVHTSGDDFRQLLSGVRHGHFSHND